ncbi:MAG: HipA family kinase [Candidatus Acidiferrales bacterium]
MDHLSAIQYVRRMRGGSQSQLMRANDGNYYVVKFQNNPQGVRILANETLGALCASLLALPVAPVVIIDVNQELIHFSDDMRIQLAHSREDCQAGLCCGSLFATSARTFLPGSLPLEMLQNTSDFLGMLVFDKWTGNTDWRQVIFTGHGGGCLYKAMMIDQGNCFGDKEWAFHDGALQGLCHYREVYHQVIGLPDFEPWLCRLEQGINLEMLRGASELIPAEWYKHDYRALQLLLSQLDARRMHVRGILTSALRSPGSYFPNVSLGQLFYPETIQTPARVRRKSVGGY